MYETIDQMMRACIALPAVLLCLVAAGSARAGEPPTSCGPANLWAKACVPGASGDASLEGLVDTPPDFDRSRVQVVYRTVEGSGGPRVGAVEYGSWQASATQEGAFHLTLPACDAEAVFGCIGTAYELYAAYAGQPCTETWYAKLIVGEPDRLPSEALNCFHTFSPAQSLTGSNEGFDGPVCKPVWARNCMPGTAGATAIHAFITKPAADRPFSVADLTLAYRTTERARSGGYVYDTTHYVKPNSHGAFMMTLAACAARARVLGCDGGNVEAWPAYKHTACGADMVQGLLVMDEPQVWRGECDTRGRLEVMLKAADIEAWRLVVVGDGKTLKAQPSSAGEFVLRLMPGRYRISVMHGHERCRMTSPVHVGIAGTVHKTMYC